MICYYLSIIGGAAGALYAFFGLAKIVIGLIKMGREPYTPPGVCSGDEVCEGCSGGELGGHADRYAYKSRERERCEQAERADEEARRLWEDATLPREFTEWAKARKERQNGR